MGVLEFGHIRLYPLRWYPSEPGGPHLQGQVSQSGPVDSGTGPGQRSTGKRQSIELLRKIPNDHDWFRSDICPVIR